MENSSRVSSGEPVARLDRIPGWRSPNWILAVAGAGFFFAFFVRVRRP